MVDAVRAGTLTLDKLEAMTSVCSVGLDMVGVPGDTSVEVIAGILADELAIGVVNNKTKAVRILPVPGAKEGDVVELGGLLGTVPVQFAHRENPRTFVHRGGQIPPPLQSLRN